jgi:transcriptional regulator with PAS, ATPase and Fis domain
MKIMAIAPYDGLKELIIELGRNEDFDLQVEVGDLEKGVELANSAEEDGIDIIISRGGTAELIQRKISIPVVEIEISGYDMLRTLTLVKDYPGKAAIVGFPPISEGASTVCQLLDIDILTYVISKEAEVKPTLLQLQKEGYEVIIGDVITVKEAENLGLNGVLITSGKESILKAFQAAKKMHHYFFALRQKLIIAQQILQEEKEGFVVYDPSLNVTYANTFFSEHFIKTFKNKINIKEAVTDVLSQGEVSTIIENDIGFWMVKGTALHGYDTPLVVFRLRSFETNKKQLSNGLQIISSIHDTSPLKSSFTKNNEMKKVEELTEKYSEKDDHIWISGERGTGKEKLAHFIHFRSSRRSYPLIIINCSQLSIDQWNLLLNYQEKEQLSYNEKGTIFFKNIDLLAPAIQLQLLSYLAANQSDCRFITSSRENILAKVESGAFSHDLYYLLAELTLKVPSLADRREDIDQLSRIFISDDNTRYGKQIAGIRNAAIEELEAFHWSGNITQLKQAIRESVLLVDGPFIEKDDVKHVLKTKISEPEITGIDLTGTLEEIEQRIIRQVWLEEDRNQTRTAERLGINRTTLWRKLK